MSDHSPMAAAVAALHTSGERTRIEVPEWEDTPCGGVLYSQPYTIRDDRKLAPYIRDDDSAGFVEIIIAKAELEDGSAAFTKLDKPVLLRTAPASVIKRIATQIVASARVSVEDAEGN